jgi:hypothetical protein
LRKRGLILALIWLSLCISTPASAVDNKQELEAIISTYQELAVDAKSCTDSHNLKSSPCRKVIGIFNNGEINEQLKSFGDNLTSYLSIDQEITLKGITAVGHITDALSFLFEEHAKKLQNKHNHTQINKD